VTAVLSPVVKQFFLDNNGRPLVGGKLFTYIAGTTTKQPTYVDSVGVTQNSNPVILDYRGEANLWIPPNVGYKFVLAPSTDTDPPTHPIWTIDQVVNSQLITLYGGVDTGSVNAYVLNFSANFAAYTDGIIIVWIPANTNTGASTINVNGLGIVNIVNPDGSALLPNEIIANQPAQILFKSGAFQLITPAVTVYGQFTAAWGGFSVPPGTTTIKYRKNGSLVTLLMPQTFGTSNSILFTLSGLPAFLTPTVNSPLGLVPIVGLLDNGATVAGGAAIALITGGIQFWKDGTQPNWTAAGNKGFNSACLMTYTL